MCRRPKLGATRPAGTIVGNSTLVNSDLRVEIEVDAIVEGTEPGLRSELDSVSLDQMSS